MSAPIIRRSRQNDQQYFPGNNARQPVGRHADSLRRDLRDAAEAIEDWNRLAKPVSQSFSKILLLMVMLSGVIAAGVPQKHQLMAMLLSPVH